MIGTPRRPVIPLLTDYGLRDEFVGVLHGVIARICPDARIIDISHGIARQDIRAGAAVLAHALPYMPIGVHVAVVDPTVGHERRAVALSLRDGRMLVGPDNGLLWQAAVASGGVQQAVEISSSPWCLQPLAATFHGRDIFAPVAARLASGEPLERAGEPLDAALVVQLEEPSPRVDADGLLTSVTGIDGFGNVQLAAVAEHLVKIGAERGERLSVDAGADEPCSCTVARTFADVEHGALLLLEDASGKLALAVNHGSAATLLQLRTGAELRLQRAGQL